MKPSLRSRRAVKLVVLALCVVNGLPPGAGAAGLAAGALPGPSPTPATEITLTGRDIGEISPYLFGANLLWPYNAEGAFDTSTWSFYPSFVEQVKQLGITSLRYPAGITADSFQWERAIGPPSSRQDNEPYGMQDAGLSAVCCTLDAPVASNVGPDELGHLLDQTGAVGNIVVNFDTGTAQQAADWVAYMTAPYGEQPSSSPDDPGYWAKLRAQDGHPAPYQVPYWEVGNEQNGRGQFGWRSGTLVALGAHKTQCPRRDMGVCLYAYGGTTAFSRETVGTFADTRPQASYSTGAEDQKFYLYFPPVVPASESVFVNGQPWSAVPNFAGAGPSSQVYTFDPTTGMVAFGNGAHGAIPPAGDEITASYQSGPHGGFVEYYQAMKKMNPDIQVCESEESSKAFMQTMGTTYPYDCVELHKYAAPKDTTAPLDQYEEDLMGTPISEGQQVQAVEQEVTQYSGRDVPVVLTEYGQLVTPMPGADPSFNLSLDEGLLVGAQLEQWISLGLPLAEKYLLTSTPFLDGSAPTDLAINVDGLSIDSAMIAGPSPDFVQEPSGQVIGLMSRLAGAQLLGSSITDNPVMTPYPDEDVPVLRAVVAELDGDLDLVVVNTSPDQDVPATIDVGKFTHGNRADVSLLNGPSPTSFNSGGSAPEVTTTAEEGTVPSGNFTWTFPAHSVSFVQLALKTK